MRAHILLMPAVIFALLQTQAEEQPSPVLTGLSSTTISGYVNTSSIWNPNSSGNPASLQVRFDDLCRELRQRGFRLRRFGNHHVFEKPGQPVLYLCKRGTLARASDVANIRRLLATPR